MPDINSAFTWAVNTCNAPNVGYSQPYRNQQSVNGITYYDCSSFIWYALKAGGFDVESAYQQAVGEAYSGNAITTSAERAWLIALGFHQEGLNGTWQAGDILWRDGHTEMVYSGGTGSGITMGAHSARPTLPNQVSINSSASYASSWTSLWRYGNTPAILNGVSMEVVSAICGNWYYESNINPGIYEGLTVVDLTDNNVYGGYGLGQWTNNPNTQVHRRTALANYLSSNGYAYDSGDGQLEFFIYEDEWYSTQEASQFSDLQDFLTTDITNIELLTHAFNIGWEGIHDSSWDIRVEHANTCYDFILQNAQNTSISEWVVGNRWLKKSEILNNAVLVYRWLNNYTGGGGGGGGGSYLYQHRMPLWMMVRYGGI